jgi:hypothetical protein
LPYDAKLGIVAKRLGARRTDVGMVWLAYIDYASQAQERGSVEGLDYEQVAFGLDMDPAEVKRIAAGFCERGMICDNRLTSWDRRQRQRERDDDSTERVRAFRKRQKELSETDSETDLDTDTDIKSQVTPSNASETPCNANETPRPGGISPATWDDFRNHYAESGKPLNEDDWMKAAMKATELNLSETDMHERVLPCLVAELPSWAQRDVGMIPFPANWLKGQPWTRKAKPRDPPLTPEQRRQREIDRQWEGLGNGNR